MKPTIYTVHAYRWGDRERHSYIVGVFGEKHSALKAAETEEDCRGGKYECEVLEWTLDASIAGNHENAAKVIKALPPPLPEDDRISCGVRDGLRIESSHKDNVCFVSIGLGSKDAAADRQRNVARVP